MLANVPNFKHFLTVVLQTNWYLGFHALTQFWNHFIFYAFEATKH